MPGARFVSPYFVWPDSTGEPIPGALLNFYASGSAYSVRANTYADSALSTPNSNPVVADDTGTFPNIFLDPAIAYGVVLTYPNDGINPPVQIWSADPITAEGITNSANASLIASVVALEALSIGSTVTEVVTLGYYVQGDSAPAWRLRTNRVGPGPGLVQSADGAWWLLAASVADVKAFGAKGNGASDDTAAVQAADAWATSVGTGVFFPSGTYEINATGITRTSPGDWFGMGPGASVLRATNAVHTAGYALITVTNLDNWHIHDLGFDFTNLNITNASVLYFCVSVFTCNAWEISDCSFLGQKDYCLSIATSGGSHFNINNNYFHNPAPSPKQCQSINCTDSAGAPTYISICNNIMDGLGILVRMASSVIDSNVISNVGFGGGIGLGPSPTTFYNTVSNNIVVHGRGQDVNGFYPDGIENWGGFTAIVGNVLEDNSGSGIRNGGFACTIIGNNIANNNQSNVIQGSGIEIVSTPIPGVTASYCVVANNISINTGGTQSYGYGEIVNPGAPALTNITVVDNDFNGNVLGPMSVNASSLFMSFRGPCIVGGAPAISPGTIASGAKFAADYGLSGARLGDFASAALLVSAQGCSVSAAVTATNTVEVVIANNTGASVTFPATTVNIRMDKPVGYAAF